ncbi:EamA family transporter, partial [Serratia marcescens]
NQGNPWHFNAVLGLCLILLGNLVMFAKPGLKWRRPGISKQNSTL